MIHTIRNSKATRVVASYLTLQMLLQMAQPMALMALTGGPSQPEFNAFTPIGTSDMVNLSSGDFNYNIPIMDVGGYPLNLAYNSGVTMDEEASWVGLGWNLSVGQINRNVRGLPDDFKGDEMTYEDNLKDNKTIGVTVDANSQIFGKELQKGKKVKSDESIGSIGGGLNIEYNNYQGISLKPSFGLNFDVAKNISVGMNLSASATEGVSVAPSVSISSNKDDTDKFCTQGISAGLNAGVSFNSRQGLSAFNLSASLRKGLTIVDKHKKVKPGRKGERGPFRGVQGGSSGSGSISFLNNTFTPSKRVPFKNTGLTFAISIGGDFWGIDGEVGLTAYGMNQKLASTSNTEKAYGYEFTDLATPNDILDFNRERDNSVDKSTRALATVNYTYDLYTINGQGIGGMFRPFRSQTSYVYDQQVNDESGSSSGGIEIEGATGFHIGVDYKNTRSDSHTGVWETAATRYFKEKPIRKPVYEKVYFKSIGELFVDKEEDLFHKELGGYKAMALAIDQPGNGGNSYGKYAANRFRVKRFNKKGAAYNYDNLSINKPIQRKEREIRNQSIQPVTAKEVTDFKLKAFTLNPNAKSHHKAGMKILQPDGSTYLYGETAYNVEKEEVTFAVDDTGNCTTGLVGYSNKEASVSNTSGIDHYFNKVVTPAYAHTYLLTSVLSSDYEDRTGDGPTDDDFGAYTKFKYTKAANDYEWRVPYEDASFNAGLNSNKEDEKGSYVYGKKELKYIETIETKTHTAVFHLTNRKDGRGAGSASYTKKIDSITLYSKPEYIALKDKAVPIKTAHFTYNYSLCQGVPNNLEGSGKLTLEKVFFTYRNSKMGKYTPYKFNYEGFNPEYNLKGYDVWGNYKENLGRCNVNDPNVPAAEFPFVDQTNKANQDKNVAAWSLTSIDLPSGGKIELEYESDDYQYVQNRRAMQMFKVVGVSRERDLSRHSTVLYTPGSYTDTADAKYVIIELDKAVAGVEDFKEKYLGDHIDKPIYFRFMLNMSKAGGGVSPNYSKNEFDYVSGYFNIDKNALGPDTFFEEGDEAHRRYYAAIPMKMTDLGSGAVEKGKLINPITKAGLHFGRKYLNRLTYGLQLNAGNETIEDIAKALTKSIGAISEIFRGPNGKLRDERTIAQRFIPQRSWIRLQYPGKQKLGGGCRIKNLKMFDQWDLMVGVDPNKVDVDRYKKKYGQLYEYLLSEEEGSSGVATYEPLGSKENPFVEPFYNAGDKQSPQETNYVEKPFGESFFPSPKITYSKVTVKNYNPSKGIKQHATGAVITNFYTSKDFPTLTDYTDIDKPNNWRSNGDAVFKNILKGLFGLTVNVKTEHTMSQGFVVETNDMDGKQKEQTVLDAYGKFISSVAYKYSTYKDDETNTTDEGRLDNNLITIDKDGFVSKKEIGVDYDVITDFRENYSKSSIIGIQGNVAAFIIGFIPIIIPSALPERSVTTTLLHTTTTTKVIHKTAILKETIAKDLGAQVSTINEAWDANTGKMLLSKTVNAYDDTYYNFEFPAYWYYENMAQASINIGASGDFQKSGDHFKFPNANAYFTMGDELLVNHGEINKRLWVAGINGADEVELMDRQGNLETPVEATATFRVIRSGYRNQQTASMASVSLMKNPIEGKLNKRLDASTFAEENTSVAAHKRILNASAISYRDFWNGQCEDGLQSLNARDVERKLVKDYGFNPYVNNIRGEWRADKSYAYLVERTKVANNSKKAFNRREGYFKTFEPFYRITVDGKWTVIDTTTTKNWTFASEVTQFSPFGAELENKDALGRYSSAQYGYNYTLPTAVVSNSAYSDMGADNFEDYAFGTNNTSQNTNGVLDQDSHFNFKKAADLDGTDGLNIAVTDENAHTGQLSLVVPKGDEAELRRPLDGELPINTDYDKDGVDDINDKCPFIKNTNQEDYDGDGIGDACDDSAMPKITKRRLTRQDNRRRKYGYLTIEGKPNAVVRYSHHLTLNELGVGGNYFINEERVSGDYQESEITLDVTGKATLNFSVQADRPDKSESGRYQNFTIQLLNRSTGNPIKGESASLCPRGGRHNSSYEHDEGRSEWNCRYVD